MANSKELYQRATKVIPGGVHSPVRAFKSVGGEPLFFDRAEGAEIFSVDGDRYIDFCQSFGPNILGHRDPDVAKAVHEMVDTAWSLGACEPYSLELSEWITERLPWVDKIRFVNSGTEAVMSALRLARAATGRENVLKFEGCYHGHADSMLVKAGSGLAGEAASDSAGVPQAMASTTLVAPLDDEEALDKVFDKHGAEIAAVILEPLPANFGLLVQREEFLKKVVERARANGSLIIFDEVISGFRVALGGMAERLGIQPDLVTYGKVIGGGFPVGAYAGKAQLMDQVAPLGSVYQAGTLSANPIGMRAGLVGLMKAEKSDLYNVLEKRTTEFVQKIRTKMDEQDLPVRVTSYGSLFWLYAKGGAETPRSLKDFSSNHADSFKKLFQGCLKRGVYLAPSGYEVGFVSYAHTEEILDSAANSVVEAAQEAYGRSR